MVIILIKNVVSISSSSAIRKRAKEHCKSINNWDLNNVEDTCKNMEKFIKLEYDLIPEKERLGKGIVYISQHALKEFYSFLIVQKKFDEIDIIEFSKQVLTIYGPQKNILLLTASLFLLSELIKQRPGSFDQITELLEKYANHSEWAVRETSIYPILSGLRKKPEIVLRKLKIWANSPEENLRRLVSESLRPRSQVKWLRDPSKNGKVLECLSKLRKDPSIYVRKSVGNNIKDLSKYMPLEMLNLMEAWMEQQHKETGLEVREDLSSEKGLNPQEKRLVWTIKHGMRWMRERNPEYHAKIEKILGRNYVLYFDEKKNKLARKIP
ncbi:MAG: hypothetical protein JW891_15810 [Candidatus Lokiarchaeota archaeon]|nr:hypothetical protein [Candidatus Lokiarchaeota archaeon]